MVIRWRLPLSQVGTASTVVRCEQASETLIDFSRHFQQVGMASRARGALNLEIVAIEIVVTLECFYQQVIHGKPDGASPVGIAAEHPVV